MSNQTGVNVLTLNKNIFLNLQTHREEDKAGPVATVHLAAFLVELFRENQNSQAYRQKVRERETQVEDLSSERRSEKPQAVVKRKRERERLRLK